MNVKRVSVDVAVGEVAAGRVRDVRAALAIEPRKGWFIKATLSADGLVVSRHGVEVVFSLEAIEGCVREAVEGVYPPREEKGVEEAQKGKVDREEAQKAQKGGK